MAKILLLFIVTFVSLEVVGQPDCTADTSGDWDDPNTWSCGVVPTSPTYDSLIINAGVTVTIPAFQTENFTGSVNVFGTLNLGFLATLNMGAGSSVEIYTNGTVTGSLGRIRVDGQNTWVTPVNPQPGPQSIDENGNGGALPVVLIYFEANAIKDYVELSWATAQEENFDYFSLERSSDGVNFKEIAQIIGTGNSVTRVDYEYTDEFPQSGLSYYRLKSVDFDDYTEIFEILLVNVEDQPGDFNVFPNPIIHDNFSIQTNFDPKESTELILYNNMGKIEGQYKILEWLTTFESINLQPGSYILKLVTPTGVVIKRILVN